MPRTNLWLACIAAALACGPVPAPPMGQTADFYVEVDEASKGDGAVLECNEDNNSDLTTAAACPAPG